MTTGLFVLP